MNTYIKLALGIGKGYVNKLGLIQHWSSSSGTSPFHKEWDGEWGLCGTLVALFFFWWMINTHENTIFETGTSHAPDTSLFLSSNSDFGKIQIIPNCKSSITQYWSLHTKCKYTPNWCKIHINICTTNFRWQVIIDFNLGPPLTSLFYSLITTCQLGFAVKMLRM